MVVDVITYNGEKDLFDIRYNVLKDVVDEFIVVEFDKTFSGKDKSRSFTQLLPKVTYQFITENTYNQYLDLALSSPNTEYGKGAEHWVREFCQKESIKDCLTHLTDNDIIFIGDCDEIWDPTAVLEFDNRDSLGKLKLKVYTYYLNNRSNEQFWGTLACKYSVIKGEVLNHLRSKGFNPTYRGWHFTSLKDGLRKKLEDSYTKETYATDQVLNLLEENVNNNKDFLGRDFVYMVDESEWPTYLKENRNKYIHLLK